MMIWTAISSTISNLDGADSSELNDQNTIGDVTINDSFKTALDTNTRANPEISIAATSSRHDRNTVVSLLSHH
jgi:hypothetical protein